MAKTLSRTVTIYINGKEVEASLKQIRSELSKLKNEQEKLPIGTQEYVEKSMEMKRLKNILNEQTEAVHGQGKRMKQCKNFRLLTIGGVLSTGVWLCRRKISHY